VRPRPASAMLQPYGSRAAVRQLLLWEDDDEVGTVKTAEKDSEDS
jgi:RND superfamily putative drug exporter